jgi:uncharacterized protein YjbI with pentapeptide repeats
MKFSDLIFIEEISRVKKELGSNLPSNISNWKNRLKQYINKPNVFVSFSDYPKFGIFYQNKWKTPTGLYAYPLDLDKISEFATDRPYMIVFKVKPESNILRIPFYNAEDYERDIQKLIDYEPSLVKDRLDYERKTKFSYTTGSKEYYGHIWNVTRLLSIKNDKTTPINVLAKNGESPNPGVLLWAKILKNILGYDGVIDDCTGTIHENEQCQAVFFNMNALELLEIIEKKEENDYSFEFKKEIEMDSRPEKISGTIENKKYIKKNIIIDGGGLNIVSFSGCDLVLKNSFGKTITINRSNDGTKINNCQLDYLKISDSNNIKIKNSTLSNSNFDQVSKIKISNSKLQNLSSTISLRYLEMQNSTITAFSAYDSLMVDTTIKKSILNNVVFHDCLLKDSIFQNTEFNNCKFLNCVIELCDFSTCKFNSMIFENCQYNRSEFPEGFLPQNGLSFIPA